MDIFKVHKNIVAEYESYIKSFINIKNEKIRDIVEKELSLKKLWPDPLIQFNPSYETGDNIEKLISDNIIEKDTGNIFKGFNLYKHQVEAIKLGVTDTDFVVTSGTGSGKSLIYLSTIFNHIIKNPASSKGLKAIIVYPMNALINSQSEEIKKFANNYKKNTGNDFPVSFGQYTGQENEDERKRLKANPPHILLTNYMMLELIMTRSGEQVFRESMSENLKYLVFDELHTYRGRQGADVSMLIRRIKTHASNKITCMGTSATMVSDENSTIKEQKTSVANVVSKIFGSPFSVNQIVSEYLIPSLLTAGKKVSAAEIKSALSKDININASETEFKSNPLSVWLESEVALDIKEGIYVRHKPMTFNNISKALSAYSDTGLDTCKDKLLQIFQWSINLNAKEDKPSAYLPFKLHQFISQTGTVYTTLEQDENQYITLEPGVYKKIDDVKKNIYPVVFSRVSGSEFICVYKNYANNKLEPREFKMNVDEDEEESEGGYLIPELDSWNPDEDASNLPDTFYKSDSKGNRKLKKEYLKRIPSKIYFDEFGNYSDTEKKQYQAWYMPAKLLFDPTSGTFYDAKTNEGTKLTKLGTEGRSTSTTVLSFSILTKLANSGFGFEDQKILSFTDNRQDAALQSGHFNDFLDVLKIRSAIYNALKNSPDNTLNFTNLAQGIFNAISLPQSDYASNPSDFPGASRDNEDAFKDYLIYRALYDLRRGWRVILPNLEQCALLDIDYLYIKDNCSIEEPWKSVPYLSEISVAKRIEFIKSVLDHFRREYAIRSENYLTRTAIDKKVKNIKEKLIHPWTFEDEEEINEPCFLRLEQMPERSRFFHKSIGFQSGLGKYIRTKLSEKNITLDNEGYIVFMTRFLSVLSNAGWIKTEPVTIGKDAHVNIYQINIDQIIWKLGDEKTISPDYIKMRSYKEMYLKPNPYFQNVYKTDFTKYKKFIGNVHTGQNSIDDRREREDKFRKGDISALFCSPTMELGIDISTLNVVHMRNAPPNPSNYAQRSGRSGRSGQAALIFTYCSSFSPHDVHYFKNSTDLVSGNVVPPRIELANEELLKTHLNALYLTELRLDALNNSIGDIINEKDQDNLPLKDDVKEKINLTKTERDKLRPRFKKIIADFEPLLKNTLWFSDEWIEININNFPKAFDESLSRWRKLYKSALTQLYKSQQTVNSGIYNATSKEMKIAFRDQKQAVRQIEILKNKFDSSMLSSRSSLSEFYPYRYFASEGFLPGYNFTRLPVRTFIPEGDSGVYISRPRFIALREFGPSNIIYHNGRKFKIEQLLTQDIENNITEAKIVTNSGYYLEGSELTSERCPLTNVELNSQNFELLKSLIDMAETRTEEQRRISCEEEERMSHGYEIKTYFNVPAGIDTIVKAKVKNDTEDFLNIRYIPVAKLIQVNNKWRISQQEGFFLGLNTGFWKKASQIEKSTEPIKLVKLFSHDTADSLYIEPIKALGLSPEGIITMQYALKRAIENLFQVESNEIGVSLMGDVKNNPNIFIYEASEGSLGILSQFVNDTKIFRQLIDEAIKICRFDDPDYKDPASYDDLLSYYNQRYHLDIDRFLIQDALEKLKVCNVEILTSIYNEDYDGHYQRILSQIDKNSITELKFIDYLHKNGLRLPDEAQLRVDGVYAQPDFFYKPDIHVYCDGTPHDDPKLKEHDLIVRDAIKNKGEQVIVYYYKDKLEDVISKRPDIFKKVK